ncbi:YybH family protein [Aeromicrobium stalagmiti]|uniref:YybH family protein n=1 Tax=Aeromicrobium stalagmiti TaxID=2738988 RepID=UPI00156A721E|nr:nuclear transport factor 2 family protein [Aeromicrobium stalagmiti]
MPASPSTTPPVVREWLEAFAAAVRSRDYAAGRALCTDDAEGFGTVAARYVSLDELEREQWRGVWDRTGDFAFDTDAATSWSDGELLVVMAEWGSDGLEPDGSRRRREGRATIVLSSADDTLRAVHTHFSMVPGTLA